MINERERIIERPFFAKRSNERTNGSMADGLLVRTHRIDESTNGSLEWVNRLQDPLLAFPLGFASTPGRSAHAFIAQTARRGCAEARDGRDVG